jgi:hypothetical protein
MKTNFSGNSKQRRTQRRAFERKLAADVAKLSTNAVEGAERFIRTYLRFSPQMETQYRPFYHSQKFAKKAAQS